jgi:hypothetical protein
VSNRNYRRNDVFERTASPEAIVAMLEKERMTIARMQRRITWLENLLKRRTAEKAAGTWPPRAKEEQ